MECGCLSLPGMLASGTEVFISRLFVKYISLLVSVDFQRHIPVQYTPDILRYMYMHLYIFFAELGRMSHGSSGKKARCGVSFVIS